MNIMEHLLGLIIQGQQLIDRFVVFAMAREEGNVRIVVELVLVLIVFPVMARVYYPVNLAVEVVIILWVENALTVEERAYKNASCVEVEAIVPVIAVMEGVLLSVDFAMAEVMNKCLVEILYGN